MSTHASSARSRRAQTRMATELVASDGYANSVVCPACGQGRTGYSFNEFSATVERCHGGRGVRPCGYSRVITGRVVVPDPPKRPVAPPPTPQPCARVGCKAMATAGRRFCSVACQHLAMSALMSERARRRRLEGRPNNEP